MPTIRLVPSTYEVSSTNLSVSNASNMYTNTDSTNYATIQNTRNGTSSYYLYIRGFNFNDVPSAATVNSITIKLKAYHSGGNTGTIYGYNGTTQVSAAGSTTALGTSATVKTFTNTTISWNTLKSYGSDFGIRINCKRNSRKELLDVESLTPVVKEIVEEQRHPFIFMVQKSLSIILYHQRMLLELVLIKIPLLLMMEIHYN